MAPPVITIRSAAASDESSLSLLDAAAREEGTRHRGSQHLYESLGSFQERWARRDDPFAFSIAVVDGAVVGFSVVRAGTRPLLDQVFVHPQARGLGVGATILRHAVSLYGAENLDALSLPGDRLTKNLYERAGLKARLIIASAL